MYPVCGRVCYFQCGRCEEVEEEDNFREVEEEDNFIITPSYHTIKTRG